MRRLWYYYLYLLLIWGSFRYWMHLPEVIEELWFKPLLWLTPLFWWNLSLKENLMSLGKKKTVSIVLGLAVGGFYYFLIRGFNFQGVIGSGDIWGVVIATAITEELTFSGFITGYLEKIQKGKNVNLLIVGVMVAVIRLPILVFGYRMGGMSLLGTVLLAGANGAINAWIRTQTGSVTGSILARIGMNLAVLG